MKDKIHNHNTESASKAGEESSAGFYTLSQSDRALIEVQGLKSVR